LCAKTGSFRGDLVALVLSLDAFLRSPIGGALLRVALTASTADGVTFGRRPLDREREERLVDLLLTGAGMPAAGR
jgi:hypothetical protein